MSALTFVHIVQLGYEWDRFRTLQCEDLSVRNEGNSAQDFCWSFRRCPGLSGVREPSVLVLG